MQRVPATPPLLAAPAEKMPLFYPPKRALSSPSQLSNQVWDPESPGGGGKTLHTQICSMQLPYKERPWDRRRRIPKGRLGKRRGSPESEEKQWWGPLGWGEAELGGSCQRLKLQAEVGGRAAEQSRREERGVCFKVQPHPWKLSR